MKMQALIFILTFVYLAATVTEKIGIDLEFGEGKIFQIRSLDEEPVRYSVLRSFKRIDIPKKYFYLIKEAFIKNNFKCSSKYSYSNGFYESLSFPEKSNVDFSQVKMHLHFQNSTSLTFTENQLFRMEGTNHISNIRTKNNYDIFEFGLSNN